MKKLQQFNLSLALPLLLAEGWLSPSGLPKAINLLIFLFLLYYLLRKPAREFFSRRLAEVRATLERAAKERETAEAKMAELDARLGRLDEELAEIRAQAEREAANEQARIEREAAAEAERLRMLTAREIESAKQSALVELREFAAAQAVSLAETIIRRELSPEDDRRLIERAGAEIERSK